MIDCSRCPNGNRGSCCGVIPMKLSLVEKNKYKFQANGRIEIAGDECVVLTDDMACIFLNKINKTCAIYEERPEVCRIYGTIEKLPCPYFKPNGNPWSEAKAKQIERLYKKRQVEFLKTGKREKI